MKESWYIWLVVDPVPELEAEDEGLKKGDEDGDKAPFFGFGGCGGPGELMWWSWGPPPFFLLVFCSWRRPRRCCVLLLFSCRQKCVEGDLIPKKTKYPIIIIILLIKQNYKTKNGSTAPAKTETRKPNPENPRSQNAKTKIHHRHHNLEIRTPPEPQPQHPAPFKAGSKEAAADMRRALRDTNERDTFGSVLLLILLPI